MHNIHILALRQYRPHALSGRVHGSSCSQGLKARAVLCSPFGRLEHAREMSKLQEPPLGADRTEVFLPLEDLFTDQVRTSTMRFTALKLNSLRDLLLEELRDLYSAETQLVD